VNINYELWAPGLAMTADANCRRFYLSNDPLCVKIFAIFDPRRHKKWPKSPLRVVSNPPQSRQAVARGQEEDRQRPWASLSPGAQEAMAGMTTIMNAKLEALTYAVNCMIRRR
jgi:hypothetical protein